MRNGRRPVQPGEILAENLDDLGLSAKALACQLAVPVSRSSAILKGRTRVSAETALRLARYFGTTPEFWMSFQQNFELHAAELDFGDDINHEVQPRACPDPSR